MQPIQQIDRQTAIDILTADYNVELYEIQKVYDTSKKILDDKYNLTIKQINALYDAYEVTLFQLAEYKTELLKQKLLELPNFTNFKLNTTLYKNGDIEFTHLHLSIKLNFNIFAIEYSILGYTDAVRKYKLTKNNGVPFTLTFKVNNANRASNILLDNISLYNLNILVIKERDIVVLWDYINSISKVCINIIKISTGELIYSDKFSYAYDKDIYHRYIKFIYCNRQIMSYYKNNKDEYIFISYIIDESLYPARININRVCIFQIGNLYSNNMFYGDERGLYLNRDGYIYFIGKLDKDRGTINLKELNNLYQKIKIDTVNDTLITGIVRDHLITNIDYSTCNIHTITTEQYHCSGACEDYKYTLVLGFTDAIRFLY